MQMFGGCLYYRGAIPKSCFLGIGQGACSCENARPGRAEAPSFFRAQRPGHALARMLALEGQKLLAQGDALGKCDGVRAPCKGKSFIFMGFFLAIPCRGVFSRHFLAGEFFGKSLPGIFFDPPRPSLAREGSTPLPKPLAPQGRGDVTALLGAQNRAELSKVSASEAFALKGWRLAYATELRFLYAIELR